MDSPRKTYQIVIVDDSEINLALFVGLARKLGECEPLCFRDARRGLVWCAENDPDLVIVDYMMPGIDGIEFISRLRAIAGREDLPILMITASNDKEVRYEALQRGATDFLNKPVDRIEFLARVRNMLSLSASRRKLAIRAALLAEEVRRATEAVYAREQELLFRMSRAAEFRDSGTGVHIQRMAYCSRLIADRLGLSGDEQDLILRAAPMHDIGKIGIPDHILLKPGRLLPQDYEDMKRHTMIGYELLSGSDSAVFQAAAVIAVSHHERFDGAGYPSGMRGEAIPLMGRIAAVADVFDALTSVRPYKEAWTLECAEAYLRENSGSQFDPACVDAFFASRERLLDVTFRYQDRLTEGRF